jgi:hypothetical protein
VVRQSAVGSEVFEGMQQIGERPEVDLPAVLHHFRGFHRLPALSALPPRPAPRLPSPSTPRETRPEPARRVAARRERDFSARSLASAHLSDRAWLHGPRSVRSALYLATMRAPQVWAANALHSGTAAALICRQRDERIACRRPRARCRIGREPERPCRGRPGAVAKGPPTPSELQLSNLG